jgi:hypothetical protein
MAHADRKTVMTSLCKSLFSKPFMLSLTGGALMLASCSGVTAPPVSDVQAKNTTADPIATIKPGAALQFSAKIDGELRAGSYSDVEITITPGYDAGMLTAEATGTEGLDVLVSSDQLSHDMAEGAAVWRVSVRPSDDGLYYLNIMARVSGLTSGEPAARTFAFAIDPGAKSEPQDNANKARVIQSGDQPLAILDAEETIIADK